MGMMVAMSTQGHGGAPDRPAGPLALPAAGLRLAAALAARPSVLLRRGAGLAAELGRVGLGWSPPPSAPGDPARTRAVRTVLATLAAAAAVLDDAGEDTAHLPPADAERLRAVLAALTDLVTHPVPAATAADPAGGTPEGGPDPAATVPGAAPPARALTPERVFTAPGPGDPGVPYDTGARDASCGPVRGRDVAATPGAVVLRTPVFELLQYLPATEQVHDVPVLVVPPLVHRYWLADLAPGFSLVEHLLRAGLQVFALSWRPAGPAERVPDLDAHAAAVLDALDAGTRITRAPRASLLGVRTGGLLAAAVQAHLAAVGPADRVAATAYLATVAAVPDGTAAAPGADPDPARAGSERAARALRAWAADRLPGAARTGPAALLGPDGAPGTVLGTPVDPAGLRGEGYLVAAADDPARPWTAGHRTAGLLGGSCRLVVAPGDRAGALIAPPGAGSSFRAGPCDAGGTAEGWWAAASQVEGSWWDDLAGWLAARAGPLRDAPPELGGRRLRPLFPAPGTYVGPAAGVPAQGTG